MTHTPIVLNYVKGGLGNQLFQHVFARSLARKLGVEMLSDVSYFGHDPYGFKAGIWNLHPGAKLASMQDVAGPGCYALKEGQIHSLAQIERMPPDLRALVLEGYWQGEAYFDTDIGRETYRELEAAVLPSIDMGLVQGMKAISGAVALHLRRRDYGHMGLCKAAYYAAALRLIAQAQTDIEVFVFSDEPNYSRHLMNQLGYRYQMVSSGSDLSDLYLMSLCRHFVISNSSYSWWGAWFGERAGSLIYCPHEWVTIDATPSPCPSRWHAIRGAVQPFELRADDIERLAATAGAA
jgi:hypothetical protein